MNVHVFWNDYDGAYSSVFEEREGAAKKVGEIVAKQNSTDDYGTCLLGVVEGLLLDVHTVSRIETVELRDKDED